MPSDPAPESVSDAAVEGLVAYLRSVRVRPRFESADALASLLADRTALRAQVEALTAERDDAQRRTERAPLTCRTELAAASARTPHPLMQALWALERAQRHDLGVLAVGYVSDAREAVQQALATNDATLARAEAAEAQVAALTAASAEASADPVDAPKTESPKAPT